MCLILVVWRRHPQYPCLIAANAMSFTAEPPSPRIGGTIGRKSSRARSRRRRHVARDHPQRTLRRIDELPVAATGRTDVPSRGRLVTDALESRGPAADDLGRLQQIGPGYNGFNLIFSDGQHWPFMKASRRGRVLAPGFMVFPIMFWIPVAEGRTREGAPACLLDQSIDPSAVLELLRDDRPAPDEDLPGTGMSLEWERSCQARSFAAAITDAMFNRHQDRPNGKVYFDEWSWDATGADSGRASFQFQISNFNTERSEAA